MIKTKIMGILNVTPDSCYDGGRYFSIDNAVSHALKLHEDGADILDIGGESTRPGAEQVSEEEELRRVIPVIQAIRSQLAVPLSIDTMKAGVAEQAVAAGACLINDVNGFRDPAMRQVAANLGVQVCIMHMLGTPKTMQADPQYPDGVMSHIYDFFDEQIDLLLDAGVEEQNIILDPGIGFGKTVAHNIEILQNLPELREMGFPVLLGTSRKDFMRKITGKDRNELLPTTIAVNSLMMMDDVDILRVHDVAEHRMAKQVLGHFKCSNCSCH